MAVVPIICQPSDQAWAVARIDVWPTIGATAITVVFALAALVFTYAQGEPGQDEPPGKFLKKGNRTLALLAGAGVVLVGIAASVAGDGPFGQVTAAWVQGIGSIAAIGAVIWVDQQSARRLAQDRASETKERRLRRLEAICGIAEEAIRTLKSISKRSREDDYTLNVVRRLTQEIEADETALGMINLMELDDRIAIKAVSILVEQVRAAKRRLGYDAERLESDRRPTQSYASLVEKAVGQKKALEGLKALPNSS